MKDGGRDQDQAVEAVEQPAVAGNDGAHVLDAEVALDGGEHQVAELPRQADDEAEREQDERAIDGRAGKDVVAEKADQRGGEDERAERAAERLIRAGLRRELAMAEGLAGDVGKDVV